MLRTRLIVGTLMAAAAGGLLWLDDFSGPRHPGLLALAAVIGVFATRELLMLFPADTRPRSGPTIASVILILAANWYHVNPLPKWPTPADQPWDAVLFAVVAIVFLSFVVEIVDFHEAGPNTARVTGTAFTICYLGLFPSFLIRLRWLPADVANVALLLAIFVPKCGDIGAYFTGRLVGRTPMAPRLSPKKTWEGFAGGTAFAVATAVGLGQCAPVFRHGDAEAVLFGLLVGWAGVLGDLAESMIKRDAQAKDASASVPGFGGVLDVIDSVIFAAPVAYLFLAR